MVLFLLSTSDVLSAKLIILFSTFSSPYRPEFFDSTFEVAPELPFSAYRHCSAVIPGTDQVVMSGGFGGGEILNTFYQFNPTNGEHQVLLSMPQARQYHMCGFYGETKFVVAGGYDFSANTDSVHVYDLSSGFWRPGTSLPMINAMAGYVPHKDTFLILGE